MKYDDHAKLTSTPDGRLALGDRVAFRETGLPAGHVIEFRRIACRVWVLTDETPSLVQAGELVRVERRVQRGAEVYFSNVN